MPKATRECYTGAATAGWPGPREIGQDQEPLPIETDEADRLGGPEPGEGPILQDETQHGPRSILTASENTSGMAGGYKIKISDGSEIGPMDLQSVRSWFTQGLIDRDSPVLKPGSKKWTTLSEVQELAGLVGAAGAQGKARGGKAGRSDSASASPRFEIDVDLSVWAERWRTLLAGILFFVAAGAAGYLAWAPQHVLPEFDGAPWLQIALALLAFALALLPGWDWGRKVVRACMLLVAIAIFPLTGIMFAQGVRGAGLFALGALWVMASGLFAFLAESLWWLKALALLVPVLGGAYGVFHFGYSPETEVARQARSWASEERRFADEGAGVSLDVPPGWVMLKPGHPLFAVPEDAKLAFAQPRVGAFAYFVSESSPRGVASLEGYLERVLANRRNTIPSLRDLGHSDITVGRLSGRKALSVWEAGGTRYRDATAAWRDGWMYFAVVSWLPEAAPARAVEEVDRLVGSFSTMGALADRLQQAVEAVVREVPQLTPAAAEILMGQSAAQVLEADQAFRRSLDALSRALPTWTPAETQEVSQLITATYKEVPPKERPRLADYIERVRAGQLTTTQEDKEMAALMKGAVQRLPPPRQVRLQALYEKAIRATTSS